nr:IclR family transcriptional regulator [Clostridia bacterium]
MNNSARRVLEMLELFSETPQPLTVTDISNILGYPKTSVFDIVNILHDRGFIRRTDDRAKTYVLGVRAYQVGMAYLSQTDLYSIAHPVLSDIRDKLGETCYLAVEEKGSIIYLDKLESSSPIRASCNIGSKNLMYLTGLGKAILAAWTDERVRDICREPFECRTPNTVKNVDELLFELQNIREQGFSIDNGEDNIYIRCIAAPILGANAQAKAAISISMPENRFTDEMLDNAAREITDAALYISRQLGYRGTSLFHT